MRRRFGYTGGELTAFEDEHLRPGETAPPARLLTEEIERPRVGPMRDIVATIQPEQDEIVRADLDQTRLRPGRARHREDGGRPAPGRLPALRAPRAAAPRRRAGHRAEPRRSCTTSRQVLPALGEVDVEQATVEEPGRAVPVRRTRTRRPTGRGQGRRPDGRGAAPRGVRPDLREPAEALVRRRAARAAGGSRRTS